MRYPAEETAEKHEKILQEASRLFRERGISEVSIGDLMKAADLTHGSFYNHFPSKQALVNDCIDFVAERGVARMAANGPTLSGLRTFISEYLSLRARDNPGSYCLMSTLGPEIAREPTAKPAMTRYVKAFIGTLASHFPWPNKANARRDAIKTTAAMVGALVLARAVDDDLLSKEILRTVIRELEP